MGRLAVCHSPARPDRCEISIRVACVAGSMHRHFDRERIVSSFFRGECSAGAQTAFPRNAPETDGEAELRNHWTAVLFLAAAMIEPAFLGGQSPEHYQSPWRTPWTYEEADHWSALDPLYAECNAGHAQSPIDIRNPRKANLPAIRFEFRAAPLQYVINNGHTIRVDYAVPPGSGDFLVIGAKRYQLTQFHFHHPSEEYIEGKPYEMEAHLMFRGSDGGVVGVAVLIERGPGNQTIQQIWRRMPRVEGQQAAGGVLVNPAGLLPRSLGYYSYTGSQTAPPCTEPVFWIVLKTPLTASAAQIRAFAQLYPHDARPIQPLNGRIVSETR
ncbi:MAG TPA: carbonic anhydrase family protein [Acidobacteriaceae bacterium]|nr:carbonic anhydrase family protein [Acidobacteriaceae bacterium]